ncbi:TPA: hypothetical protein EYO63_24350 [Candidatus Poribacteria bacterium]|nr:hypothetical protein [Candidatus Poribacteria bacterium]
MQGFRQVELGDRVWINPRGRSHNYYRIDAIKLLSPDRYCLQLDVTSLLGRGRVVSVRNKTIELDFHIVARTGNLHQTRLEWEDGNQWEEIESANNPDRNHTVVTLKKPPISIVIGEWVSVVDYVVDDTVLLERVCFADESI